MRGAGERCHSPLFDRIGENESIRAWVVDCATGEETYTLAILFLEEAARRGVKLSLQIFAAILTKARTADREASAGCKPPPIE